MAGSDTDHFGLAGWTVKAMDGRRLTARLGYRLPWPAPDT